MCWPRPFHGLVVGTLQRGRQSISLCPRERSKSASNRETCGADHPGCAEPTGSIDRAQHGGVLPTAHPDSERASGLDQIEIETIGAGVQSVSELTQEPHR